MAIEAGAADGTSQGKTRRIHRLGIKLFETLGLKYGKTENDQLDAIEFRGGGNNMDEALPLFTGEKVVSWPDGNEGDGIVTFVQDQPFPCTIAAVMPHIVTQDSPGAKR
jgi:hypothetical protein